MAQHKTRIAMIGAGSISDYHVPALQQAGADVVAIFSRTLANAEAKAQQYGIPACMANYDELLARDDIDAVIIATPDFTHEDYTIAALNAGKAVLAQKPMGRSASECERMIRASETTGLPLYVSFMHRYFEEVAEARRRLAEGALGQVYMVRLRNATPGANWADWFYQKAAVGGGVVLQLGVHGIDLLRQLCGEIEAVKATTGLLKTTRQLADGRWITPDNEDIALITYRMATGALVTHEVFYNEVAGTDRFRMEIYGDRGTLWLRTERGRLAIYAPEHTGKTDWIMPELPPTEVGLRQHRHFLAMLRGDSPPDQSAQDGLASLLVAEAIYRAAESETWERVRLP
ncbi:MAG: Gfo/Idh/MocA family oxidoreductase [Anaerolineae bacterium]|nr:Gfo/Idh/MocA family oxidoreductase [Anaerolineae bacterium]